MIKKLLLISLTIFIMGCEPPSCPETPCPNQDMMLSQGECTLLIPKGFISNEKNMLTEDEILYRLWKKFGIEKQEQEQDSI